MILKSHQSLNLTTNINSKLIYNSSRLVSNLMNMPVQPNKAIVGRNAFAHSSGIHQDGVLKNRENYEIIDPVDVGIKESSIILTARSGRAALNHRLEILGFQYKKDELDEIYHKFLQLADKKKNIDDDDIRILTGQVFTGEKPLKLELLQVTCGKSTFPVATVGLRINGEVHTSTASGNGPIDASFTAVKQLINKTIILEEFLIQAITRGSDDLGKVHVQVEYEGRIYYGFSANTDIITASVEALIDAISKIK
jgi:2-isopropylmalate synthase